MKDDIKDIVICEVNKKIANIQEKYSVQTMWYGDKTPKIINIDSDILSNANEIAKGAKFRAIENIINNVPSNSIIFYAPKGAKIKLHSHPQTKFCICLSGKIMFILLNNEYSLLEPIESIYILPNDVHEIEFLEDSQMIITWHPKLEL